MKRKYHLFLISLFATSAGGAKEYGEAFELMATIKSDR